LDVSALRPSVELIICIDVLILLVSVFLLRANYGYSVRHISLKAICGDGQDNNISPCTASVASTSPLQPQYTTTWLLSAPQ